MNKKIRLVGGPAGGKVIETPDYGRNEIIITGPKKMTRKQKWDWIRDHADHVRFMGTGKGPYDMASGAMPKVEARYRITRHPMAGPYAPCMHPDGSIFYEYVEGSKREL